MKLRADLLVSRLTSSSSQATATTTSSVIAVVIAATTTTGWTMFTNAEASSSNNNNNTHQKKKKTFQIETDFMDRLGSKPYLESCNLPKRLRVLAVDVPEMRHAFDGECRLNLSKVYADGIAPPKIVKVGGGGGGGMETASSDDDNNNNKNNKKKKDRQEEQQQHKLHVVQKSFVKSFVKCRKEKKIGVELLEASIADLNPNNLRKMHHFMHHKFDPGKYAAGGSNNNSDDNKQEQQEDATSSAVVVDSRSNSRKDNRQQQQQQQRKVVLATEDDELDAPWNQYAWMEELELRLGGKVPFGGELTAANRLQRLWNGNVYKSTIPSSRAWWEWCLPPWFHRDPAGTDDGGVSNSNKRRATTTTTTSCWASHRPHAVIANGAALQRVPGSLRFLQRTCTEVGIPLFVINDPRVWGGHMKMEDALQDLRKAVKNNCMSKCLGQTSAFARGRAIGTVETELRWQTKDAGRQTREAIQSMNRKIMMKEKNNENQQQQQQQQEDWSELNGKELEQKLVRHKVIRKESRRQRKKKNGTEFNYSDGMKELILKCMDDMERHHDDDDKKKKKQASRPTRRSDGPSPKSQQDPILSSR